MKDITIRISDSKLSRFLELIREIGGEVVNDEPAIPQWQKEQVQLSKREIKEGKAEIQDWNLLRQDLFEKYKAK